MLYDDDASMRASLLGFSTMDQKEGKKIQAWRNNGTFLEIWPTPLYPADPLCTFPLPHSSAYVDINGDCRPDLVLHCQRAAANERVIQVYLNRGDEGYVQSKSFNLPTGSRAFTFADMSEFLV
jgi:integrin alpha FG-GAP repeat containing protein 1